MIVFFFSLFDFKTKVCVPLSVAAVKRIGELIERNRSIHHLSLHEGKIGDEAFRFLSISLINTNNLKSLNLERCHLSAQGIQLLSEFLKINHTLMDLNLAHNTFKDEVKWIKNKKKNTAICIKKTNASEEKKLFFFFPKTYSLKQKNKLKHIPNSENFRTQILST